MLERVGLDPAIASGAEPGSVLDCVIDVTMKETRQRCRACSTVDECEQWLAGNRGGENDFCPNAKVFNALRIICAEVEFRGQLS
jgi:hypothetical protein